MVARLQLRSAAPHRRSRHRLALGTHSSVMKCTKSQSPPWPRNHLWGTESDVAKNHVTTSRLAAAINPALS